jgi:HAD superfamily phosphatase (TIGR01668 family)
LLEKLVPAEAVEALRDVDLAGLQSRGVKAILIDLDNTITPWRSLEVPERIDEWLEAAKQSFRVCMVSNTSKLKRLGILRERLGIEGLGFVSKPWGMRRAMRKLEVQPRESCVIGDQLLTDVLGGNMAGAHTVLVKPLSSDEFFATKFTRMAERFCFGLLKRRGLFERPWE